LLGEKPTKRSAAVSSTPQVRRVASGATASLTAARTASRDRVPASTRVTASAGRQSTEPATLAGVPRWESNDLDAAEMAVALVESKVTRQPVDFVHGILVARAGGVALNRIAKDVDRHHSAVKRIIDAAAAHQQGVFASVG